VVATYRQTGARQAAVAALYGVSVSFLKKLMAPERQSGSLVAKAASRVYVCHLNATAQA
jgi:hypothetical protein